jgi:hypothetical protein
MTDVLAQARARRVTALFTRYGETFTLTTAEVNRSQIGLFTPMDGPTLGTYFDGNESVGLLRPALSLYSDGAQTDPPAANDVFSRDGRLWTIRKTYIFRLVNTPVLILALCD